MRSNRLLSVCGLALMTGFVGLDGPAYAGTKSQTNLVPNVAGASPGLAAPGSSIKIDGQLALKGKVKKVVDGTSALVSTDGVPSVDDYTIEVDLSVPATALSGTVTVPFDVKKGVGKFSSDLSGDPVFVGAVLGAGVVVTAIRVKDGAGTVIGVGGIAIE